MLLTHQLHKQSLHAAACASSRSIAAAAQRPDGTAAPKVGRVAGPLKPGSDVFGSVQLPGFHASCASCHSRRTRRHVVKTAAVLGGLGKLFKQDPSENTRKKYQPFVVQINALEPTIKKLTDQELRAKTDEFKERIRGGESLESLLPEVFAVVREASWRVLGLRPFDVQLIGGMVLHEGQIAEMRTGEGKTLVAILPAYLNALSGKGVHVVTVNDYLARRDSEWVGQVPRFLGLKVGLIQSDMTPVQRREAYKADITYVTNSELGFDYLRDNLAVQAVDLVLRPFNYCVIDEVDSILIDEARTPLIISGTADKPSDKYYKAAKLADALARDVHYTVDEKQKNVLLTEDGYEAVEDVLQVSDLYNPRTQWASYIINALKAKELHKKNVNYIVKNEEIIIVDEFTGRTMPGRRWSDGLHQAVEAKESLTIRNESITLATISYQAFFRSFPKLAGMTGTAATEVSEFDGIYKLPVAVVPTNRAIKRDDNPDVVFRLEKYKFAAAVTEIMRMHKLGRPVLVGTTSVEKSEVMSEMLEKEGIPHQVLNAKPENVERESEIIAQSGRKGSVTISTNMAGRGTDIILGGNPDFMARLKLREMLMPKVVSLVEEDDQAIVGRAPRKTKSWAANPQLFPCDLSADTMKLAEDAVAAAVAGWGEHSLTPLEAEDRLAFACEKGVTDDEVVLKLRASFQAMLSEYKALTELEKAEVVSLGGLHVVGTERHESRRIDNQLRGRSGRQGDPGSTRFFLSLEDNLFRIFGGDKIKNLMVMFQVEDLPMESQMLTDALDTAQKRVENYFFDMRKNLFEYDQVVNSQRDKMYAERRRCLLTADLSTVMVEYAEKTMDDILEANINREADVSEWNLEALLGKVKQYCYLLEDLPVSELYKVAGAGDFEALKAFLRKAGTDAYWKKVESIEGVEKGLMKEAERYFLLTQTDRLWQEHLQAIKFLQQAVGMRGYAGRDPLTEFKLEAYNLFVDMTAQIRRNVIYNVYMFIPQRIKEAESQQQQLKEKAEAEKKIAKAVVG